VKVDTTLTGTISSAIQRLRQAGMKDPRNDVHLLIQWTTGMSWLDTLMQPERLITTEEYHQFDNALRRRMLGEPVYRIIGERDFYGLHFILSPDTFEPRPDTETVVDLVLPFLQEQAAFKKIITCLDMGTGSGIIAIALLINVPTLYATGVDIAQDALRTAYSNAKRAGVESRFTLCKSDWFQSVIGQFDLIISNPPYIPHADIADLDISVRGFDPLYALDGGEDGLDFYRALASNAKKHLHPFSGKIAVEIGIGQRKNVAAIFARHGYLFQEKKNDLAGIERALIFTQN